MGAPQPTVSVIIYRSRILDRHHAWVRIGDFDAGYLDLQTGRVHCADERYTPAVTAATAPLLLAPTRPAPTADVFGSVLGCATAVG